MWYMKGLLFSPGYQLYKRKCGGSFEDSEAPSLEDGEAETKKEKHLALENGGFELNGNSNHGEKSKDFDKNTQLWDNRPLSHLLNS